MAMAAVEGALRAVGLTPILAPTKGHMQGVLGDTWTFKLNISAAKSLGFLPAETGQLSADLENDSRTEVLASFRNLKYDDRHRTAVIARGFY